MVTHKDLLLADLYETHIPDEVYYKLHNVNRHDLQRLRDYIIEDRIELLYIEKYNSKAHFTKVMSKRFYKSFVGEEPGEPFAFHVNSGGKLTFLYKE